MDKRKVWMAGIAAFALVTAAACSFTTAHISSLKLSKDKEGTAETASFGPKDTIYAVVLVSNVPKKVTVKCRFFTEQVKGQKENAPVESFDRSFDLPSDGRVTYYVSPPPVGWPPGKYRIEASMFIESGEQKDQKSATFTVAGE